MASFYFMTENPFTTNNNPLLAAASNVDGRTPVYLYADPTTHALAIAGSISVSDTPITAVLAGEKTVANTAVPEAMAATTACVYALVQAKPGNTVACYVGSAGSQKVELAPGAAWAFAIDDLAKIFIDVGVNGEGVNYTGG